MATQIRRVGLAVALSVAFLLVAVQPAHAVLVYWDIDGATAGSGPDDTPDGTWNATNTYWNSNSGGTGATAAWTTGNTAVFAAGTDASGTYTVSVGGTQDIAGLTFEEGTVTLSGGTALRLVGAINNAYVDVASGTTATVSTVISQDATDRSLTKTSDGTLVLTGLNTYQSWTWIYGGGTIEINSIANWGTACALGAPTEVNSAIYLGNTTTSGTLKYTGPAASTNRPIDLWGSTGGGTIDASGSGALVFTSDLHVQVGGGSGAKTLTLTGTNTDANTISGAIVNTNDTTSLTKSGAGLWVLSGANTYTGLTTVSAGTLLVNNTSGSGTGTGTVTVSSGATLGGTGIITGAVNMAGILAPGTSIETLDTGNLTINSTGTLDNELGRDGVTPISDLVNVTGTVTLDSGANLKLTLGSGLNNPVLGDIFFLVSNDSDDAVTGVFNKLNGADTTLNEGSQFSWNGLPWTITYKADYGTGLFTGGNDIAIPEPATLSLLAAGLGALWLKQRRR